MPQSVPSILCLFSSFEELGGIQVSARLAWQAVQVGFPGRADFFCFGRAAPEDFRGARQVVVARSKPAALLVALRHRWAADRFLIWHMGLARLIPALRFRMHSCAVAPRIAVFLHGIEIDSTSAIAPLSGVHLFLHNSEATWRRFAARHPAIADSAAHRLVPLGLGEPATSIPVRERACAAVTVGRLDSRESYKGHRELIEAWPAIRRRIPAAELWVIGEGNLRPRMERLADSVCPGAVKFFGYLSEGEKEDRLRRARGLVMPSRGEGFGLVYVEAMRVGTPCLVGAGDAGYEVVAPPEAGLAVDAGRPEELVAGVVRLLTPGDEWNRWSEQARRRYESDFTARHFQRRLLDCLLV